MSPRAAWRLEYEGFETVYEYAAGKVDWMAAGLPTVRGDTSERRALEVADRTPPTCAPDDRVSSVAGAIGRSVIVVNDHNVVLGRVTADRRNEETVARSIMEPGPTTIRAHEPLIRLLDRMASRNVSEMLVTTPEGELLGVVYQKAADDER
jgi:CBS domain-containing protein